MLRYKQQKEELRRLEEEEKRKEGIVMWMFGTELAFNTFVLTNRDTNRTRIQKEIHHRILQTIVG